jgi:hypothetical protein
VTFDSIQTGTTTGLNTQYTGTASFTSLAASYTATDASAVILIADSPNLIEISLSAPGANLPDLAFNVGGTGSVATISLNLDPAQSIGSEDINDYLNIGALPLDSADGLVIVPSTFPPTFSITSATSTVPVPAAVWLFGSALAGLGWLRRKQTV